MTRPTNHDDERHLVPRDLPVPELVGVGDKNVGLSPRRLMGRKIRYICPPRDKFLNFVPFATSWLAPCVLIYDRYVCNWNIGSTGRIQGHCHGLRAESVACQAMSLHVSFLDSSLWILKRNVIMIW